MLLSNFFQNSISEMNFLTIYKIFTQIYTINCQLKIMDILVNVDMEPLIRNFHNFYSINDFINHSYIYNPLVFLVIQKSKIHLKIISTIIYQLLLFFIQQNSFLPIQKNNLSNQKSPFIKLI